MILVRPGARRLLLLRKSLRRAPSGGYSHAGREFRGGQFIPRAAWEHEKQIAAEALPALIEAADDKAQFLLQIYQQNAALLTEGTTKVKIVPLEKIERQIRKVIRESYSQAFRFGKRAAGNLTSITPAEAARLKRLRLDEYTFLRRFLADVRNGRGRLDYATRMGMYANAIREAYWRGFVLGDRSPERRLKWAFGGTVEHCKDCAAYEARAPFTVQEFIRGPLRKGHLPQAGKLECKGIKCQCKIVEVKTGAGGQSDV